ncbi:MAG: L-lysine dehydrogenase, partial [Gammaproteobacteria bacterium]|nr:L-lysine dehydrogenase [Gammaproteobacteria bacterium]
MAFEKIAVLGLGKVGHLAAELLHGAGFKVTAFDARTITGKEFSVQSVDVADPVALRRALKDQQAV